MEPGFHEDWFPQSSQAVLARLGSEVRGLEGSVVEVGSWEGRSTIALARAVAPETVHAVDTWAGHESDDSGWLAEERDVKAQFLANVAAAGVAVEAHQMGWADYFAAHREPVKLLFIDGAHTYPEVMGNLEAAVPLVVPGGVVCGDDFLVPGVAGAVLGYFGAFVAEATMWWVRRQA